MNFILLIPIKEGVLFMLKKCMKYLKETILKPKMIILKVFGLKLRIKIKKKYCVDVFTDILFMTLLNLLIILIPLS